MYQTNQIGGNGKPWRKLGWDSSELISKFLLTHKTYISFKVKLYTIVGSNPAIGFLTKHWLK